MSNKNYCETQDLNWLKKAQQNPPKVIILSYIGELLSVLIGDKKYQFYASPVSYKKIDNYIKNGWYGNALKVLNQLEKF